MNFNLFGRSKDNSLKQLIDGIKNGERDFHKLLGMKPAEFNDASFGQLMANPDDVIHKVNRVQMNFKTVYFGIFDHCLIKHNDDGDVKFTFYTTTNAVAKILSVAKLLFDEFGDGIFESRQYSSFREEDKVHAIADGRYTMPGDEPGHHWLFEDISISLHYLTSPARQFTLDITINAPAQKDNSVRRKGTILDLLSFDPAAVLAGKPVHERPEMRNDKVVFTDYTYHLKAKEFDLFNVVEFRIFGEKRKFNKFVRTQVTLYSIGETDPDKKIAAVESLLRIYGPDNHNSGELEFYERDKIEEGVYWLGRTWRFNEAHGLHDFENKDEKIAYEVRIDNMEDSEDFKISITGFDNLYALFGLS